MLRVPNDTPKWVENVFGEIEEHVDRILTNAKNSDEAMKAAGAYELWKKVKDEVESERNKQELSIKQRNERLNARLAQG